MNFGQEEEDDSSSKETGATAQGVAVEHQQDEEEEEDEELDEEEEEEEEEEEDQDQAAPTLHFASSSNNPSSQSSSAASPSVIQYKNFLPQHQAGLCHNLSQTSAAAAPSSTAFNFEDRRLEFVDLSLGNSNETDPDPGPSSSAAMMIEKEHMFDKVVTPSDVGKLNRLVIPKQHAEKYFPLDSSSNEKGLLLNFEDRNGKPWRFRYSYWNSSQSYVMTKGWSRFVKEKKLDAGDIVSFQRGVGEAGKHRLYIDWRRRPNVPDPLSFPHHLDQLHFPQSVRWGRLYSLPQFPPSSARQYDVYPHPPPPHHQFHHQQLNYGAIHNLQNPYGHNQYYHSYQEPQQQYYLRSPGATANYPIAATSAAAAGMGMGMGGGGDHAPMVIDSVPVVHGKTVGKRLRLFGVNMECQPDEASSMGVTYPYQQQQRGPMAGSPHHHYVSASSSSSSIPPLQFQGVPAAATTASTTSQMAMHHRQHEYSKKGKTSSLSFDLDL